MKATKVLGIVLGALLVAALFTGAAAATDEKFLGNAYAYVVYDNATFAPDVYIAGNETWTDAAGNSVTFLPDVDADKYYINGDDVAAEGDYYVDVAGTKYHITVKMPTAAISGSVYKAAGSAKVNLTGALIGSTVMNDKFINVTSLGNNASIAYTNPEGTITTVNSTSVSIWADGTQDLKGADLGTWTVQAYFAKGATNVKALGGKDISLYAPDFILGAPYYFTIISSDDGKKLEAVTEEIVQGGYATVKVTAPTGLWNINVKDGFIPAGQPLMDNTNAKATTANITIGSSGIATFVVSTDNTSNIKVELHEIKNGAVQTDVKKSVTIKVKSGAITAVAESASVFIGNDFDIDGTNDLGGSLNFFIKGTNFKFQQIQNLVASGKVWTATVETGALTNGGKKPDAGTYTIYVASLANGKQPIDVDEDNIDNTSVVKSYATVSVALKQPFITITKAPEVLVQGEKLVVEGSAEGEPGTIQYYIFGTNKFIYGTESVTDGEFSIEISKDNTTKDKMAAGQYFLVVQHPMYDKFFNIFVGNDGKNITLQKEKNVAATTVLFNTDVRQSANAAQALCDALDSQDIDDMYAKASFIVAGPTSFIDPVPSQITKGQVLTISGTTTGHKDDVVSVELLSTAFAAIPKEAVGSASFVALTTKIGDDGVWSISFDTSALNADEYTCSVAVGQLDATSSKVTIVEGTNPQPTQTAGPVTPTAQPTAQPTATPATPGFGALAALAGLGAVAVLLLRRQ